MIITELNLQGREAAELAHLGVRGAQAGRLRAGPGQVRAQPHLLTRGCHPLVRACSYIYSHKVVNLW
jgi:hypothetical protein